MNIGGYNGAAAGLKLVLDDLVLEVCLRRGFVENIGLYIVRIAKVSKTCFVLDNSVIHSRGQVVVIFKVDHTNFLPVLSRRIENIRRYSEGVLENTFGVTSSITSHDRIQPVIGRGSHLVTQQKTTKPITLESFYFKFRALTFPPGVSHPISLFDHFLHCSNFIGMNHVLSRVTVKILIPREDSEGLLQLLPHPHHLQHLPRLAGVAGGGVERQTLRLQLVQVVTEGQHGARIGL